MASLHAQLTAKFRGFLAGSPQGKVSVNRKFDRCELRVGAVGKRPPGGVGQLLTGWLGGVVMNIAGWSGR